LISHYTKEFKRKFPVSEKISRSARPPWEYILRIDKGEIIFPHFLPRSLKGGVWTGKKIDKLKSGSLGRGNTNGCALGTFWQTGMASKKPRREVFLPLKKWRV